VPAFAAGFHGYCHARSGRVSEAQKILNELKAGGPSLAYQAAVLCLGLGDRDAALAHLDEARATPSLGVHWLKIEPIWDDIRADPRFTAVVKKMGL
jgi:hypothetical protein